MKQTVAISAFAEMLARQSGYTIDFCERFVLEMFKTASDALKDSNEVTIKGFGKFSVIEDGNIDFTPDITFAAEINAPFDCFEPEPLDDDITEEQLLLDSDVIIEEDDDNIVEEESAISLETREFAQQPDEIDCSKVDNTIEMETTEDEVADNSPQDAIIVSQLNIENIDSVIEPEKEINQITVSSSVRESFDENKISENSQGIIPTRCHRGLWPFLSGTLVGVIAGAAVTYFVVLPCDNAKISEQLANEPVTEISQVDSIGNAKSDSVISVVPESSIIESPITDTEVYDTVTSTLAQLSRKHFGTYEFWVYIYEENKDIISDPDRVEPNIRVRIPNAEKYGIDANDHTSINNALKKSQEIALQRKKVE